MGFYMQCSAAFDRHIMHLLSTIALVLVACAAPQSVTALTCSDPPLRSFPYCNTSLPVDLRVADLLARMSPDEKVAILDAGVPAIPRLGLPSMSSGEALHGACSGCLSLDKCATSFPAPIALGAAFDQQVMQMISRNIVVLMTDFAQLWLDVGLAIGTESRALYNEGSGHVWLFAPNINLLRDPRWGRAQEVPGEDATLVAAYAAAFVRGVQASCPERRHPS